MLQPALGKNLAVLMRRPNFLLFLALATSAIAQPGKWAGAIEKFTKADATNPPPQGAVLFIGSSFIGRWTSPATDFATHQVINRGFGGSHLGDSVFYLDRVALPDRPRVVVLYAGDNDRNAGKAPGSDTADFTAFCTKIHAALPETRIVFIAIKPSPARWKIRDKREKANALIAA